MDGVLRLALSQGSVVSLSAGLGEDCFTPAQVAGLNSALQADQERHVTVVASSGDFGAASTACAGPGVPTSVREADLPASDPLVLAAGGTTLDADPAAGTYLSESACHSAGHRKLLRRGVQSSLPAARLPGRHRRDRGGPWLS
ncbi:MAG: hypothetical protein WAL16_01695 [Streptosporangiaceae bacterium]